MNRVQLMKAFYPNTFALLLTAVSASATKFSTEQPSPQAMAEELGIRLPRLPWHLVDLWWQFEEETHDFEKLEVDVTIDRNVSADYNLYVSPVGIAKINGLQFYGGLQTNVNGWVSKKSRSRVHPGSGGIFSRWSHDLKEPIGLSHVRMAEGGLCESAGYEGQFCSVRRPFFWGAGTYTYSIVKGKSETLEGKPHTWFLCMVRSHETGVETYVGSLRFEGKSFTFWIISFISEPASRSFLNAPASSSSSFCFSIYSRSVSVIGVQPVEPMKIPVTKTPQSSHFSIFSLLLTSISRTF